MDMSWFDPFSLPQEAPPELQKLHEALSYGVLCASPLVFAALYLLQPSTYGKLHRPEQPWFGPLLPARMCWVLFESPNLIWVAYMLCCKENGFLSLHPTNAILLAAFAVHYIYRTLYYLLVKMSPNSRFPAGLMFATTPYCMINGL